MQQPVFISSVSREGTLCGWPSVLRFSDGPLSPGLKQDGMKHGSVLKPNAPSCQIFNRVSQLYGFPVCEDAVLVVFPWSICFTEVYVALEKKKEMF